MVEWERVIPAPLIKPDVRISRIRLSEVAIDRNLRDLRAVVRRGDKGHEPVRS